MQYYSSQFCFNNCIAKYKQTMHLYCVNVERDQQIFFKINFFLYGHLLKNSHLRHRMMNFFSLNSAIKYYIYCETLVSIVFSENHLGQEWPCRYVLYYIFIPLWLAYHNCWSYADMYKDICSVNGVLIVKS